MNSIFNISKLNLKNLYFDNGLLWLSVPRVFHEIRTWKEPGMFLNFIVRCSPLSIFCCLSKSRHHLISGPQIQKNWLLCLPRLLFSLIASQKVQTIWNMESSGSFSYMTYKHQSSDYHPIQTKEHDYFSSLLHFWRNSFSLVHISLDQKGHKNNL